MEFILLAWLYAFYCFDYKVHAPTCTRLFVVEGLFNCFCLLADACLHFTVLITLLLRISVIVHYNVGSPCVCSYTSYVCCHSVHFLNPEP